MNEDGLTIADAAARLGISERRLRHFLSRHDYAARMLRTRRQTQTGIRQSTLLPPDLIAELAANLERESNSPQAAAANETKSAANPAEQSGVPAVFWERLLAEKDARIAELSAQVERLAAALDKEQENLARNQALLAIGSGEKGEKTRRRWWFFGK